MKQTSSLYRLDNSLDQHGHLRVGGCIKHANIPPNILPWKRHISELVIRHYHQRVKHQGCGMTLNELQSCVLWIIGGNSAVANHIFNCVTCRKLCSAVQEQKMADLLDLYSRKRWRRVQHLANEFWTRWRKEFLLTLQEHQKWVRLHHNVRVSPEPVEYRSWRGNIPWQWWTYLESEACNWWCILGFKRPKIQTHCLSWEIHPEVGASCTTRRRWRPGIPRRGAFELRDWTVYLNTDSYPE